MRKLNCLLVMLALCVLWGCSEDDGTSLSVSADTLIFPYTGGTQTLTITCDSRWGISLLPEWLSVSVASETGVCEVTLTADSNPDKEDRNGSIVVYTEDGSQSLNVAIRQDGMHTCPIEVDSEKERVFGGRKLASNKALLTVFDQYFTVTCETEWEIEVPSWITVAGCNEEMEARDETHFKGSGTIFLTANETYTDDESRNGIIMLKTFSGESSVKIPVRQLGKDEIHCFNPIVTMDGFMCDMKVGSNVENITVLFNPNVQEASSLTYADFNNAIITEGARINADHDGTYISKFYRINDVFQKDMDYNMFFIGINTMSQFAPLSKICHYTFHSKTDVELRPRVEITDVYYAEGNWYWTVKPNDYTICYYTTIRPSSYFPNLSSSQIGLLYRYQSEYYGIGEVGAGDSEKTFSTLSWPYEDVAIVAMPIGISREPSVVEVYVTDISSTNYQVKKQTKTIQQ